LQSARRNVAAAVAATAIVASLERLKGFPDPRESLPLHLKQRESQVRLGVRLGLVRVVLHLGVLDGALASTFANAQANRVPDGVTFGLERLP
jgi:hypothetical protein